MRARGACFLALLFHAAIRRGILAEATCLVTQVKSCPDVGYFFRREQAPNAVGPGPCYLCFCQHNGTATCWEREHGRCDVERFHHHRVGRSDLDYFRHNRVRRSPVNLAHIFFRDAAKHFFANTLPKKCKPFESTFNDGCPPEDWCQGCTICECDAGGQWDCRVLAYCDGDNEEKGRKPGKGERIFKKNNLRKINSTSSAKKKSGKKMKIEVLEYEHSNKTEGHNKLTYRKPQSKLGNASTPATTKPKQKLHKKVIQYLYVQTNRTKDQEKNTTKHHKKNTNKQLTSKPLKKKTQLKKSQPGKKQQNHANATMSKVKVIKRHIVTRIPMSLQRGNMTKVLSLSPVSNNTVKMGKKVVKTIITVITKTKNGTKKANKTKTHTLEPDKENNFDEVHRKDKETYNIKSNAARRNKTKHIGQATIKENYTHSRSKREILNETQAQIENVNVVTLETEHLVIPLQKNILNTTSSTTLKNPVVLDLISTTQYENYYKYSITNDDNVTTTVPAVEPTNNATERNETDTNVVPTVILMNETVKKIDNKTTPTSNPDFNDLKFPKWFIIKVKTDNKNKSLKRLVLPKPNATEMFDDTFTTHKNNFDRIVQKKTIKTHFDIANEQNWTKTFIHTRMKTKKNITGAIGLNNILLNLFTALKANNTSRQVVKPKVRIMKYARKFFHKLFSKNKVKDHKSYGMGPREDHTLQILCDNVGPCKINSKNRSILRYKLQQLNKETETILRSIKIIKGLLHLLQLSDSDETARARRCTFEHDVVKLGMILRNTYNNKIMNTTLTDEKLTQINHIKKNTQAFIESVKRFTDILNETLAIIRPDIVNVYSLSASSKNLNYTVPVHKIKNMLHKYNIIQNNFMKKMYELMNEMEKKTITTTETATQAIDFRNNKNVIDNYSKNIIENLRRLKTLAEVLNSRRKKRHIMTTDGPMEYLLTLIEYLIKRHQPAEAAPAQDGIDLLIDAIRNAPDIKPIKKNVLDFASIASTAKSSSEAELSEQLSKENVDSRSNGNMLKEENTLKDDSSLEVEQTTGNDTSSNIPIVEVNDTIQNNEIYETTTEYNFRKRSSGEKEKVGFDKFESNIGNISKNLDIYLADIDDDSLGDGTTGLPLEMISNATDITYNQSTEDQTVFTTNIPEITTIIVAETTPEDQPNDSNSSESQYSTKDSNKTKLDWIEEIFDREIKEFNELNASHPVPTHPTTQAMAATKSSTVKHSDNVSGISVEEAEGDKRLIPKIKTEDLMYKKQLEFLNSLDYGTEKNDFDISVDTKDEARSDDGFPSYFV